VERLKVPIDKIIVSKDNPRQSFDEEGLRRLGESIKEHGQLQAIIVRPKGSQYELVVGERRLRACALVGINEVEAEIREVDDATAMELRLIENTQREDLSDAEKGDAVLSLWANYDKYETLEDVAKAIGFACETIKRWVWASKQLSPKIRQMITPIGKGGISNRAIRRLIKYSHGKQEELAQVIIAKKIPTTKVEEFTKLYDANPHRNLDEIADEVLGIETVTIRKDKIPPEILEKINEEKTQLAKVQRIRKKRSKPITKEEVKKKTDFKFERVKVTRGLGQVKPPSPVIKPTILGTTKPDLSQPDWTLCKCPICPLFGQYCKGRRSI
jgi:ParB family chromosome partitioning protein